MRLETGCLPVSVGPSEGDRDVYVEDASDAARARPAGEVEDELLRVGCTRKVGRELDVDNAAAVPALS